MDYRKPEIVELAGAVRVIQGGKGIANSDSMDPQSTLHTVPAYEADE
ncbi:MAG: hypothetical protein ACYDDI_15755 [Candidatus Acidiferrales bacterium]